MSIAEPGIAEKGHRWVFHTYRVLSVSTNCQGHLQFPEWHIKAVSAILITYINLNILDAKALSPHSAFQMLHNEGLQDFPLFVGSIFTYVGNPFFHTLRQVNMLWPYAIHMTLLL